MTVNDLKKLSPEERIKKLKELEEQKKKEIEQQKNDIEQDKKEIEDVEKEIKNAQGELNEKRKVKEKVPIPEFAKEDLEWLSEEGKQILSVQKEASGYGVTSYFSVVIPKIDAKANVVANVDTSNKKEYLDALSKGIAHAKSTNFPGQNGRIFLFSHSTDSPVNFARYNAIFYLLKKLSKGDEIIVFFADKKYKYEVTDTKITSPDDTSWLLGKMGEEELVLMTCDPPGTTWNRLMVVAKPLN